MSRQTILPQLGLLLIAAAVSLLYFFQANKSGPLRQWFYDSDVNGKSGCDFYGLYHAGHALLKGDDIYSGDPEAKTVPCCFNYRYLPIGATIGAAFNALPPTQAYFFWLVFLEALALGAAWLSWRMIGGMRGAVAGSLWLVGTPLFLEFYMGQFNLLQAFFVLLIFIGLEKKKSALVDFGICSAMLWKLTGWLTLPALIIHRRWKLALIALVLGGATTLIYFLFAGKNLAIFWNNFLPIASSAALYHGDLGWLMLLRTILSPTLSLSLMLLTPVIVIAIAVIVSIQARRAPLADHLALWFCTYFFIYPTIWEHHYVMLLPPMMLLFARRSSPLLVVAAFLYLIPTPYYFAGPHGAGWAGFWPMLYHASKLLAPLLVGVVAAVNLWRKK